MRINKCDVCGKTWEIPDAWEPTPIEGYVLYKIVNSQPCSAFGMTPEATLDICSDCLKKGRLCIQYVPNEVGAHWVGNLDGPHPKPPSTPLDPNAYPRGFDGSDKHRCAPHVPGVAVPYKLPNTRPKPTFADKEPNEAEKLETVNVSFQPEAEVIEENKGKSPQVQPDETFGQRVERLRKAKGWHQIDLARATVCGDQPGLSLEFISNIEVGTYWSGNMIVPRTEETVLLAAALDVSLKYLETGEDAEDNSK